MKHHLDFDENAILEELDEMPHVKNMQRKSKKQKTAPQAAKPAEPEPATLENQPGGFDFSYSASRHERIWISDSLGSFYEEHWFDDVLRLVKGGKEASVYQCLGNQTTQTDFIAAKVYRPRMFRNLRNDHLYREGREDLDSSGNAITEDGMLHAIKKRTNWGKELLHSSWIEYEYQALEILYEAGADVPRPYARGNNAILMEYIGDAGTSAPTLNSIDLGRDEAEALFQRVLRNVEIMLNHNRVHADLSAYNILYWGGEIVLIDFPQAIDPLINHNAYPIFERDITRVCEYFRRQGVRSNPREIASQMWTAHQYQMYPELDPRYLDDESEEDRQRWEQAKNK